MGKHLERFYIETREMSFTTVFEIKDRSDSNEVVATVYQPTFANIIAKQLNTPKQGAPA